MEPYVSFAGVLGTAGIVVFSFVVQMQVCVCVCVCVCGGQPATSRRKDFVQLSVCAH